MATEGRRGCGYRKVHGIYLVSDALDSPCDRMPFELSVCPCCGAGIKAARGWTWIKPIDLFETHIGCGDVLPCPMCMPEMFFKDRVDLLTGERIKQEPKAGLLWVGDKYYSPTKFCEEASRMGVSRRIAALPRDFRVGKTWVFLAHAKAVTQWDHTAEEADGQKGTLKEKPGIFCAFRPKKIEYIVNQSEYDAWKRGQDLLAEVETMGDATLKDIMTDPDYKAYCHLDDRVKRGMTLVPVPDDDPDHH